jgi:hypothetical protein
MALRPGWRRIADSGTNCGIAKDGGSHHIRRNQLEQFYNRRRPHSSLDGMTPDQAYFGPQSMLPIRLAA